MTLPLFLNAHQLAGFIQRCHVHCSALQYVCMFRFIEQTYIICGDFRVRRQNGINQIGNSGFRRTAQFHRDIGQHIQIIIDNGLTGDTEQLAIGRQCNSGLFISGGDVFIFRPFTHLTQSTEAPHTHTMGNFKIRQLTFPRPLFIGFRSIFPALQNGFVRNIQQNITEVRRTVCERRTDHLHRVITGNPNTPFSQ
ncbi:hypothetical protein ExPECSC048_05060 [Escherichia coli]|nr:hypothetical protein ExPECSC048_05060 [Escherichia coli]